MVASTDVSTYLGDAQPSYTGSTASVIPEAELLGSSTGSNTGVSTRCTQCPSIPKNEQQHWYALRTTYGREKKAYDYIIQHGGIAFLPTALVSKVNNGKKTTVEVSRIPNIFFAFGTEDSIKEFVYDNVNLPFLRFYYNRVNSGKATDKVPMIVPDYQMKSFQIICGCRGETDTFIVPGEVEKYKRGDKVRIKKGDFEGVVGVVARYRGQQRVGVVIGNMVTAITAYIPTSFLEKE